jgi:hypothetical protein
MQKQFLHLCYSISIFNHHLEQLTFPIIELEFQKLLFLMVLSIVLFRTKEILNQKLIEKFGF